MRRNVWLVIVLAVLSSVMLFTASCNKEVVQTEQVTMTEPEVQKEPEVPVEEAEQDGQLMEQLQTEAVAREAETPFVSENVHFAFDSAELSAQARQILNSMADYLQANQETTVMVEGHCDERGTNEYNVALGERRAESVKGFLVASGIGPARLKTVSYGEERPIAMGQNEASWAQNRRAEFVID